MDRVILMVMDSVVVGELPDAKEYGDQGAHTLKHAVQSLDIPRLSIEESLLEAIAA